MQSNRNNFWGFFFALLGVIFISWFAFVYRAEAATVLENPYDTENSGSAFSFLQYLGDLEGLSFDRARFWLDPAAPHYDVNTYIGVVNCSDGSPISWLITDNINQPNTPGLTLFEASFASTTATAGQCYTAYIFGNSEGGIENIKLSPSDNDFTAAARYSASGHMSDFVDGGTALDYPMFFQLCNGACEDPVVGPPPDEISITYPENATSTADFAIFSTSYNLYSTTTNPSIFILYDTASSTIASATSSVSTALYRDYLIISTATGTAITSVVPKYHNLTIGQTYYAKAFLQDFGSCPVIGPCLNPSVSVLDESPMISFTVSGPGAMSTYFPTPTSTATSSEWVLTCDEQDGLFSKSICYVFKYTLFPSGSTLEAYSDLRDDLSNKPPFGYFSLVSSAINDINFSATSSSSTVDLSNLNAPFFSVIKEVIQYLLWILFVFWLFSKIREINL